MKKNISRKIRDVGAALFIWGAAGLVMAVSLFIVVDIGIQGVRTLDWNYFTQLPAQAGRAGGISSVLVSTVILLSIALAAAIPLGVGTAVFLSEFMKRRDGSGPWIRRSLDILAGVPSIVFGLFGMAFFCRFLGWGWSLMSGGLTLACMAMPLIVKTTEVGLRDVPSAFRQGCEALGLSKYTSLKSVLLPSAARAVTAGLVLGMGRALAETAAVMYTAGASIRMPTSLFSSGRSLAYHIYILSIEVPGGTSRAYGAALVLIFLILGVNGVSYVLMNKMAKNNFHLSR